MFCNSVKTLITHVINIMFLTEIIPKPYTYSTIITIHKGGDKSMVNKYRPIPLTRVLKNLTHNVINVNCLPSLTNTLTLTI